MDVMSFGPAWVVVLCYSIIRGLCFPNHVYYFVATGAKNVHIKTFIEGGMAVSCEFHNINVITKL